MRTVATLALAGLCLVAAAGCKRSTPPPTDAAAPIAAAADPWASPEPPRAAPAAITKPFLFAMTRAEQPGVTTYLFGTMHIGINAETQLPPWVWDRFAAARTFAMEADVTDPSLLTALVRTDGGTLEADLGPDHWSKLKAAIGDQLAAGMNRYRPFAVLTLLATKDLPSTPPMDQVMHLRAKERGKAIVFFESARRQLELIDPFMTAADVKAYLDNLTYAKQQTRSMIDIYLAGDDAGLGRLFDDQTLWTAAGRPADTFPAYLDTILGQRNASWIPAIEKLHADGGGFVAVGAGHLVGPRNLGQLLAERGYTVTRVTGP